MSEDRGQPMRRRDFITRVGSVAGAGILLPGLGYVSSTYVIGLLEGGKPPASSTAEAASPDALATLAGPAESASSVSPSTLATYEEVSAFLGPIAPGFAFWRWRVVDVHGVRFGALPITLEDPRGRAFQVDVMRREPGLIAVEGVANTRSLSVFVVNGGNGRLPTDEEQGLGAIALSLMLAGREAGGAPVPRLLTLRERARHYPAEKYGIEILFS